MKYVQGKWLIALGLFLLAACNEESAPKQHASPQNFPLHIRMKSEPDRLHPMLSRRSNAAHIEKKIFYPLMQVDPSDLQLKPLLARTAPTISTVSSGPLEGDLKYIFEILPDARWEDGTPVTARDYLFTVKAAQNTFLEGNQWQTLLRPIDSVALDPLDPKSLSVYIRPGINADLVAGNFELYPEHHYDPERLLSTYTLRQLKGGNIKEDSALVAFTSRFASLPLSRSKTMGCGPYEVEKWEDNQQLILRQKADWWGDKHASSSALFEVNPGMISYHFIPDQTSAIALLQSGQIDQLNDLSPAQFNRLRENADTAKLGFYTPVGMRYYMIAINHLHPALQEKEVRKALALCTDTESFIGKMMKGLAVPISGPIHPSKPFALWGLKPIPHDLEQAAQRLKQAGWTDTDRDGILDKIIRGQHVSLDFEFLITGGEAGKNLALLLKQDAAKVGIKIRIQPMRLSAILKRATEGDYDLAALSYRQSPGYDQMAQTWHSQSISGNGKNYFFYNSPLVDRWSDSLSMERDTARLRDLYHKIQQKIYDDQPAIFLCAPVERIAVSKKFIPYITPLSPGYVEEWYKLYKNR